MQELKFRDTRFAQGPQGMGRTYLSLGVLISAVSVYELFIRYFFVLGTDVSPGLREDQNEQFMALPKAYGKSVLF